MVALPGQLFYNTTIPACLWFVARDKKNHKFRDRRGEILFIDARNMGKMLDRRHKELIEEDIQKISDIYHAWRGEKGNYQDIPGFCKVAKLEKVRKNGHILTPGRYVDAKEEAIDNEKFEDKMKTLITELSNQMKEEKKLNEEIKNNLKNIGFQL
jgi:type I restriction enzyme M protein